LATAVGGFAAELFGQRSLSYSQLRDGTGAFVATARGEITHPAQGAARRGEAGRTLLEALLRECAD
jgi:hypothetical protein